ncbi:MAG: peptidoglycan-associated lipoprotein Pal [Moraxellaceae bacterium]|nr:peptidoglycan-associated lipoprotein Pal [Moraxellaceae bacterium]MDZ4299194.1 peptidoglycan-associated lipoprotein Pal [Moraxellaceae bacterium]MDZ4387086.1 peptidoglycan-associated lipoprotein Pal [Moraxellaceae bacterium]
MNLNQSAKIATVCTLVLTMTACSVFRGPRPIDPNDDSQFENLPPAPAVVSVSEDLGPTTGAANLGLGIEGNVMATDPSSMGALSSADMTELLRIRVFYFGTNLSDITAQSYGGLNAHARYLTQNSNARLQLSGHTDERGTREYNLALGERRANAVARYLVSMGVNAGQLSVVSYGKEKPAADGSDESAWAQNRRVELDYVSNSPR